MIRHRQALIYPWTPYIIAPFVVFLIGLGVGTKGLTLWTLRFSNSCAGAFFLLELESSLMAPYTKSSDIPDMKTLWNMAYETSHPGSFSLSQLKSRIPALDSILPLAFPLNNCDRWSTGWCHHFHLSPCEWWHVSPRNGPMGPLKTPKLSNMCHLPRQHLYYHVSSVLPRQHSYCHAIDDVSYHVSSEDQSYAATCPLEEREKGLPDPVFACISLLMNFGPPRHFYSVSQNWPLHGLAMKTSLIRWYCEMRDLPYRHVQKREGGNRALVFPCFSLL